MGLDYNFNIAFPKIKETVDKNNENHSTFEIEPLENGFGITVGNALRRISLSTLPGSAISSISIKGASHEYAMIDNAVEDVTAVILAVKDIKIRMENSEEDQKLILKTDKSGDVTAGMIECPPGVEVINKDLKLLTLNNDEPFEMTLTARSGRGYVLAEENRGKEKKSGEIFVDSLFSPTEKFTYNVEDTRVGDKTNYDKLTLEVWTNGILTPKEVLVYSSHIMTSHLNLFVEIDQTISNSKVFEEVEKTIISEIKDEGKDETSIETLDISNRAYNGLKRANINTIEDLCSKSKREISSIDNIGAKTVDEIESQLKEQGIGFKEE